MGHSQKRTAGCHHTAAVGQCCTVSSAASCDGRLTCSLLCTHLLERTPVPTLRSAQLVSARLHPPTSTLAAGLSTYRDLRMVAPSFVTVTSWPLLMLCRILSCKTGNSKHITAEETTEETTETPLMSQTALQSPCTYVGMPLLQQLE